MDETRDTGVAANGPTATEVRRTVADLVGRRVTRATREQLGLLAARMRGRGRVRAALDIFVVRRSNTTTGELRDVDLDLLDAALDAGMPIGDPPAGTALGLGPGWVGADGFRPKGNRAAFG